jgi:Fe2+ transport system protein FeoA
MTEINTRSLVELKDGQTGHVVTITGGRMAAKRLADLGLTPGVEIKIIRKSLFSGPVQVEFCGSKFLLGKGLASKILVQIK